MTIQFCSEGPQLHPFSRRCVYRTQPGSLALESLANDVETPDILGSGNSYARAGSRAPLNESLILQTLQGLSHRYEAHAEAGGELARRENGSKRIIGEKDAFAQDEISALSPAVGGRFNFAASFFD
jgi:hypothetical protein